MKTVVTRYLPEASLGYALVVILILTFWHGAIAPAAMLWLRLTGFLVPGACLIDHYLPEGAVRPVALPVMAWFVGAVMMVKAPTAFSAAWTAAASMWLIWTMIRTIRANRAA